MPTKVENGGKLEMAETRAIIYTPTNKRKLPLKKWSIKFYYLCKINSVVEIIKIHYLIQTQGKIKKKSIDNNCFVCPFKH